MTNLWNGEAEQGVVGALLLGAEPDQIARVRDLLPSEAFHGDAFRGAYVVVCALIDQGTALDPLTLRDASVRLLRPLDADLLAQLADSVPTTANILFHARIVRDLWLRRLLAQEGRKAQSRAEAMDVPVEQGYAETVTGLVHAVAPTLSSGIKHLSGTLFASVERMSDRQDGQLDPGAVSTGLNDLDDLTGGLAPKRLIVAAAGPKKGKTSLALAIARQAANTGPVYYVSLEMGEDELSERILLAEAGVVQRKRTKFSDREVSQIAQAANSLQGVVIDIDTTARTPAAIRLAVQSQIALGKAPTLVVIDYLQLLRWPGKSENKNIEIGNITRFLKLDVAMSLNVPVLLLSQLSRARVEHGKERPPILTDLRDSGSIEQDADQILMLHYAGADDGKTEIQPWGPATRTELYVRGNRHGPGGHFDVYYDRRTGQWRDLSRYDG